MLKKLFLWAAFSITALYLIYSPAFAAYSWVDDSGVLHITDYPRPVKRVEPKEETPAPVNAPAPEVKQLPLQAAPQVPVPPQVPKISATATVPLSAGTLTTKPAAPLSQITTTQGSYAVTATTATVSSLSTTATTTVPLPVTQAQPQTALPVPAEEPQVPTAGIMAFVMAFFMVFLVLLVGMYVFFSLCLYLIAKKLNVSSPWTAWIPIVNIWTLLQAAGKPCWWVLLFFIPLVSIIVVAYVWMCIVENLGRNKWLGLLMLVPVVNLVYIGVLAFSKEEQQADLQDNSDMSGQEWKPSAEE